MTIDMPERMEPLVLGRGVFRVDAATISDRGLVRQSNEDSYICNPDQGLFVVCDGMGGHKAGAVASRLAVEVIAEKSQSSSLAPPREFLADSIRAANHLIISQGGQNPEWSGMGTTVTAALLTGNLLTVANVGDSAVFFGRDGQVRKLTCDHTLAEEMVRDGLLREEEIRNSQFNHVLTRALGVEDEVEIDFFEEQLTPGDLIMLCSDGLSDLLDEEELAGFFQPGEDLEEIARNLLNTALGRGGYDNITIVLVRT